MLEILQTFIRLQRQKHTGTGSKKVVVFKAKSSDRTIKRDGNHKVNLII